VTEPGIFSLHGRTALVTGGSRGIGEMIAGGLLDAGARVLITARSAADLDATVERLSERGPCEAVTGDLASTAGCRELATRVAGRVDALDILVNNAGATWIGPFDDIPEERWDEVMAVNITAVHYLTVALLPLLRHHASAESPSRVLIIGSTSGLVLSGLPDVAYEASKAAVHQVARHHAAELVSQHILVNVIAPGLFHTRMSAFLDAPELRDPVLGTIPMGRPGNPEEIAGAAVFLASRAGGYMTGQVLVVDGGRTGIGRADPVTGLE
jgi:NAD(P)-dependent dehydrogenase (short-subunit alcohol dehydrogenase family)